MKAEDVVGKGRTHYRQKGSYYDVKPSTNLGFLFQQNTLRAVLIDDNMIIVSLPAKSVVVLEVC